MEGGKEKKTPAVKPAPAGKISDGSHSTLSTPKANTGKCPGFQTEAKNKIM